MSVNFVDFLIGMGLAVICAVFTGELHLQNLIVFPLVLLSLLICVSAWSICVAAINSRFRDLVNIAPFILQLLLIASPVGYTTFGDTVFTRPFYYLNPLVGIIEAMRFVLLDYPLEGVYWGLLFSSLQSLVVLCFGFLYFRRIEDAFSDVI